MRRHRRGHLYFELVEKGEGDAIVGKLEAVIWASDHRRIERQLTAAGVEITDGQTIRCCGGVDFYPPFGRVQLVVRDVDPVFTQGLLALRRRETLEWLAGQGLLTRNRELALVPLPLRLALVTSEGSAAYHDFLSSLRESGYGFRVLFLHASVQGREAEGELVSALGSLAGLELDCAVLIRGGGSRTDLAVFDSRRVAEAVARAPVPVLTGLGHEIDESIADLVAHTALKTPTKVAEFLVGRVAETEAALEHAWEAFQRQALEPLRRARVAVERAERSLRLAGFRLGATRARLGDLAGLLERAAGRSLAEGRRRLQAGAERVAVAAPRLLRGRRREPDRAAERIAALARVRLREAAAQTEAWSRLCTQLGPQKTLARGFSITRDLEGRPLREAGRVAAGERILTELASGRLISRVEER